MDIASMFLPIELLRLLGAHINLKVLLFSDYMIHMTIKSLLVVGNIAIPVVRLKLC